MIKAYHPRLGDPVPVPHDLSGAKEGASRGTKTVWRAGLGLWKHERSQYLRQDQDEIPGFWIC